MGDEPLGLFEKNIQSWEVLVMFHETDEDESEAVALMAMSPVKRPRDFLKVTYKNLSRMD